MTTLDSLEPTPQLKPWLVHQHSLTDRLKAVAHDVRLDVLRHEWSALDAWDQQTLCINLNQHALHREILMWASTDICWYARTIVPLATYQAEVPLFSRLRTQSLGELIWSNPNIERVLLKPYPLQEDTLEYHFLTDEMHQRETPLWARLSTFSVRKTYPFYLLEIFLPGLRKYDL